MFRTFCSTGGRFSRQTIIGSSSSMSSMSMLAFFGLDTWKMFKSEGNTDQGEFEPDWLVKRKHSE
jgi:hypothetical protein